MPVTQQPAQPLPFAPGSQARRRCAGCHAGTFADLATLAGPWLIVALSAALGCTGAGPAGGPLDPGYDAGSGGVGGQGAGGGASAGGAGAGGTGARAGSDPRDPDAGSTPRPSDAESSGGGGDAGTTGDGAPEPREGGAPAAGLGPVGFVCPPGQTYGNPLPPNPRATTLRSGFMEAEGPVWLPAHDFLLVSDINENLLGEGRILKYTPATDQWIELASKVGTNGLALDVDGTVVAASHDLQALTRIDPLTGARTAIPGGGTYNGRKFTEVNDVVIRTDGNMYFTDPSFQPGAKGRPGQDTTAYYRLSPAGVVTRIAPLEAPNGIALSPDGGFLYVAGAPPMRRHKVAADGSVDSAFTPFYDSSSDGMAVDCAGNLYLTTGNGVLVLSAAGQPIGTIAVPSSGFMTNAAFGGADRKTLFITTRYAVHQIRLLIPGFPN